MRHSSNWDRVTNDHIVESLIIDKIGKRTKANQHANIIYKDADLKFIKLGLQFRINRLTLGKINSNSFHLY